MPGFLLTMQVVAMCVHGGMAKPTAPNVRVKLGGTPVPMSAPPWTIAGCANPPPPANIGPCVIANVLPMAGHTMRVKSMGQPLLCVSSQLLGVPTPAPINITFAGQVKVKGQ